MPFRPRARDIFEILVREHADMLTAYLRGALDRPSDVDDLFQETMVVAWRRLDDYDRQRPFGPWLRGIARNLVLAHYRSRGNALRWCSPDVLDALEQSWRTFSAQPGDSFRDRVDLLVDCIARLSDRLRTVIEMAYGRGMPLAEIARATGDGEPTIRKRAERARRQLHDCILQTGPDA